MKRYVMFFGVAALIAGCTVDAPADAQPAQDAQIRNACLATGLDPSEAPFAYCLQAMRARTHPQYAYDVNAQRAQRACAAMGYPSSSEAYASCVGNLNQTLFDAQHVGSD